MSELIKKLQYLMCRKYNAVIKEVKNDSIYCTLTLMIYLL